MAKQSNNQTHKLTKEQQLEILRRLDNGEEGATIARSYGVRKQTVYYLKNRRAEIAKEQAKREELKKTFLKKEEELSDLYNDMKWYFEDSKRAGNDKGIKDYGLLRLKIIETYHKLIGPVGEEGVETGYNWEWVSYKGFVHSLIIWLLERVSTEKASEFKDFIREVEKASEERIEEIRQIYLEDDSEKKYKVIHFIEKIAENIIKEMS